MEDKKRKPKTKKEILKKPYCISMQKWQWDELKEMAGDVPLEKYIEKKMVERLEKT